MKKTYKKPRTDKNPGGKTLCASSMHLPHICEGCSSNLVNLHSSPLVFTWSKTFKGFLPMLETTVLRRFAICKTL